MPWMHTNAAEFACSQHTRPRSWLLPRQMRLLSHSTHLCLLKSQINLVTSTPAFLGVATKLASDAKTCVQTISKRSLQSWPLRIGRRCNNQHHCVLIILTRTIWYSALLLWLPLFVTCHNLPARILASLTIELALPSFAVLLHLFTCLLDY